MGSIPTPGTKSHIDFVAGNRTIREATDFTKRLDASEFLKTRIADALGGKIVLSKNVTYDDLRGLILTDYTNNGLKSLGDLKTTRLPGVPRTTAMAMIGHKTESIYRRYSIVDQAMLEMGTLKLEALQQTQKARRPVFVSIREGKRS